MKSSFDIGIVGAGIGGLTAAIALRAIGHQVTVYEQAGQFMRVGADINLTPNAVRALDGLGEAVAKGKSADAHWAHMVIHGLLHLQGHDHEDDAQAEAMEALERSLLKDLGIADPYQEKTQENE